MEITRWTPVLIACAVSLSACSSCKKQSSSSDGPAQAALTPAWKAGVLPHDPPGETPATGGTLTVRIPAEPAMLNRLHDGGHDAWATRTMFGHVYETLLKLDLQEAPAYPLAPSLAEKWTVSEDGLTTTFHLRKGVTFHDGQPFSSKDVMAIIDAVQKPENPTTAMRGELADLDRCAAKDAHTVVCTWKKPAPLGMRNLALNFPIMPASALSGAAFDALEVNRSPIGTGPFKFVGWETNKAITLVRNDAYWGRKAYLDKVVLRIVKDHTVATQMFERGEFDLMTFILPSVWRALQEPDPRNAWAWKGYHRIRETENSYNWIGWNQKRPFFAHKKLRRALSQLVPTSIIYENITLGLEPTTTCPYYSRGPYCDPALEAQESAERVQYNPKAAKALLSQMGWRDSDGDGVLDKDGKPFRFTFLIYAHSVSSGKLAPLVQEEFRKAGIDVEIERVEWAVYTERLRKHDFDVVNLGWSTQDVENDLSYNFHSSQSEGGGNYVSYSNPEVDRLLEESRTTFDEAKRIALNRRIHRMIYDDQVYTFLGVRSTLDAVKTHVRGLRPSIAWYRLGDVWLAPPPAAVAEPAAP